MGFFSGLLKAAAPIVGTFLGGPAGGMIGQAVSGAIGGWEGEQAAGDAAYGQDVANAANAQQAQLNRDFQERMSNTQWQRGVEDMKAAGLNPMLAYSQGGASSPSGATSAPMQNSVSAGIEGKAKIMTTAAQVEQAVAQTQLIKNTASKTGAEIANIEADTQLKKDQSNAAGASAYELTGRGNLHYQTMTKIDAEIGRMAEQNQLTRAEVQLVKQQVINARAENQRIIATTGNIKADTVIKQLNRDIVGAEAKYSRETGSGPYYIRDAGRLISGAKDAVGLKPRR